MVVDERRVMNEEEKEKNFQMNEDNFDIIFFKLKQLNSEAAHDYQFVDLNIVAALERLLVLLYLDKMNDFRIFLEDSKIEDFLKIYKENQNELEEVERIDSEIRLGLEYLDREILAQTYQYIMGLFHVK